MPEYRLRELWSEKERERGEHISWDKLAAESEVKLATLQKISRGGHVTTETLEKLASYFNVHIGKLFK